MSNGLPPLAPDEVQQRHRFLAEGRKLLGSPDVPAAARWLARAAHPPVRAGGLDYHRSLVAEFVLSVRDGTWVAANDNGETMRRGSFVTCLRKVISETLLILENSERWFPTVSYDVHLFWEPGDCEDDLDAA